MAEPVPFLPSRHGFEFTNAWPAQPAVVLSTPFGKLDIGNAGGGLCGGMVFAALDFWHAGTAPPPERPAQGDALFSWIVRRLVDSWHLPAGVTQYYQWMNLPDGDRAFRAFGRTVVTERGLAWRTLRVQWPQVRADLDRGVPVPLGVVTVASSRPADLGHNHQVLAYGYELSGGHLSVRVYDPNRGPCDDVTIGVDTAAPSQAREFTHNLDLDRPVRGFFRTAYTPLAPP